MPSKPMSRFCGVLSPPEPGETNVFTKFPVLLKTSTLLLLELHVKRHLAARACGENATQTSTRPRIRRDFSRRGPLLEGVRVETVYVDWTGLLIRFVVLVASVEKLFILSRPLKR